MSSSPLDVELLRDRDPAMTERFLQALRRYVRRYLRDSSDVEHVAHDALAELLTKLARGDSPESVPQWVATAASNAAKRHKTARRVHASFASTVHTPESLVTPTERHRQREQLGFVESLLERMPSTTRYALIATSLEGRRAESVADELGLTPGTVRKDVSRARERLRRELSAREKLDRLRAVARELQRRRGAEQGQPPTPERSGSGAPSSDSSATRA